MKIFPRLLLGFGLFFFVATQAVALEVQSVERFIERVEHTNQQFLFDDLTQFLSKDFEAVVHFKYLGNKSTQRFDRTEYITAAKESVGAVQKSTYERTYLKVNVLDSGRARIVMEVRESAESQETVVVAKSRIKAMVALIQGELKITYLEQHSLLQLSPLALQLE